MILQRLSAPLAATRENAIAADLEQINGLSNPPLQALTENDAFTPSGSISSAACRLIFRLAETTE